MSQTTGTDPIVTTWQSGGDPITVSTGAEIGEVPGGPEHTHRHEERVRVMMALYPED